ncbi:MAG: sodium:alanine symporter family protein [Blautia sp.]|nr:sodium:alanine symporter family protein [Blautia sp.]MDY5030344.1 sodium:alanine symporter family protein [Blautia sp.]
MSTIEAFFKTAADFLWKDWMLFMLLGLGIYYTIMTGFVQVRFFPYVLKSFISGMKNSKKTKTDSGKFSSNQALFTAIASCVGSGNIVGVSTAILSGGPGALLWMWVAALLGMATKFAEITLGVRYHGKTDSGEITGGPMYYIAHGFKAQWVGAIVAVLLFIQNAGATLIQSNTISGVVQEAFSLPPYVTGILLALLMTCIISGGFKRLVHTAEKVVPVMAVLYIFGGLIVILLNITSLPGVLVSIFKGAFTVKAGVGAAAGLTIKQAMRYGVARGLYSNEAGEGSAAVLHAAAQVDHPVRQGMYGIMEVFIDTILLCSTTGFTVLITGVNQTHTTASTLAAAAFGSTISGLQFVIYISLILFAGTSIMSQWYFGHVSLTYLKHPKGAVIYRFLFPVLIMIGSLSTIDMVWSIQDCALGLLIIPNVIALIILGPEVRNLLHEFTNPKNGYLKQTESEASSAK